MGSSEAVALRRLLDVTLALAAERRTEPVLRVILEAARDLAGARYAALGVPDGAGGYSLFLTAGIDAATWAAIGALPRTHGLLGALLDCPRTIRLDDIRTDPRFGGWPVAHPDMRSFLGVPIVAGGEVLAELFLADKTGPDGGAFTDSDQRLIETLSAHAALAVANAQRTERTRELSVAEERARLARELHDSVTQTLFSLTLAAESAAALAESGDPGLAEQLGRVRELARTGLAEMRSMVGTLRPVDPGTDGLAEALRKRVDLLRRVHDVRLSLRARGPARLQDRTVEREVLLVASEALGNALQHAGATAIEVTLDTGGDAVRLLVADDGTGFDLAGTLRESRRLGLTSMRERAEALGGTVHIDTAPGAGTRVTLEVPGAC
ncbi:MAG: GAF domain-containing sensor histidine kinase [Mycobacteriales bacterium]